MLEVTRAAFYKWLRRKPSATQKKQKLILSEIKRIHALPRHQDYGSPRMHRELISQGTQCCENTVAKLMREHQIQARNKPKFRVSTTDSNLDLPIAPNRLGQQFTVSNINRVWLTDFTYIPTTEGFSYLCEQVKGVRDRFWEIGNCPSIIDDVACILSKRRFLLRLTVREAGGKLLQFGGNYFTGGIDGSST